MKKLIIDRKKWYRGRGASGSSLLLSDGTMCCLGFYALSCGKTEDDISGKQLFAVGQNTNCLVSAKGEAAWLGRKREGLCVGLASINDDVFISQQTRESQISEIFENNGVKVKFIN